MQISNGLGYKRYTLPVDLWFSNALVQPTACTLLHCSIGYQIYANQSDCPISINLDRHNQGTLYCPTRAGTNLTVADPII